MSLFRALSPSLQKLKKPSTIRTVAGCCDRGHCCFGFGVWLLVLGDGAGVGGDAGEGLWGWLGRRSGSHKLWGWVVWHTHLEIDLPIDTRIPAPLFGGQWGVAEAEAGGGP